MAAFSYGCLASTGGAWDRIQGFPVHPGWISCRRCSIILPRCTRIEDNGRERVALTALVKGHYLEW